MDLSENELYRLLEKYYAGESTRDEEERITDFYKKNPLSAKTPEQQWFGDLGMAKLEDVSETFDGQINERLNRTALRRAKRLPVLMRIAAFMAGIILLIYAFRNASEKTLIEKRSSAISIVTLSDSTKVWLNAGSILRYPKAFTGDRREVWLEGEGYFEVTPDAQHIFQVRSGETLTQVMGTAFNIRLDAISQSVKIAVTSGTVGFSSVDGTTVKVLLTKGKGGIFEPAGKSITTTDHFDQNLLAWRTHQLHFDNLPMEKVMSILAEYYQLKIVVKNDRLKQCRFTGNFNDASLDEILSVMRYSMGVTSEKSNETVSLSGPDCQTH
jgi:transmembrane sensor